MRSMRSRLLVGLAVVAAAGVLNQTACIGFGADQLQRTIDFCFLFDCQTGALGGLLDPCPNNPNNPGELPLFVDCTYPAD